MELTLYVKADDKNIYIMYQVVIRPIKKIKQWEGLESEDMGLFWKSCSTNFSLEVRFG